MIILVQERSFVEFLPRLLVGKVSLSEVAEVQKQLEKKCPFLGERSKQARITQTLVLEKSVLLFCLFCQAMSILSVVNPNWEVADLSQNMNRMPVVLPDQSFVCVTSGAEPTLVLGFFGVD